MGWMFAIVFVLLVAFFSLLEISLSLVKHQHFLTDIKDRLPSFYSQKSEKVNIVVFLGYYISFIGAIIFLFKCLFPILSETGLPFLLLVILHVVILFLGWALFSFGLAFIAYSYSIWVLRVFKVPMAMFYYFLYPFTFVVLLIIGLKQAKKSPLKELTNNNLIYKTVSSIFAEREEDDKRKYENTPDAKIFKNAMEFSQVKVKECMVPRTEIVAIDENETMDMLRQKFIETGYSKIIVYSDNIDNVVGYVHSSGLFKNPVSINSMLYKLLIVPESMPARKMLQTFMKERKSIGVVVDEFGGVSGMVTVEDIIEEIFGEIMDEHDSPEYIEKQISETEYVFSGRLEIDYLNDKYKLNLPDSDQYETIAGLILYFNEKFPKVNELVSFANFQVRILKSSETKIELVKLILSPLI